MLSNASDLISGCDGVPGHCVVSAAVNIVPKRLPFSPLKMRREWLKKTRRAQSSVDARKTFDLYHKMSAQHKKYTLHLSKNVIRKVYRSIRGMTRRKVEVFRIGREHHRYRWAVRRIEGSGSGRWQTSHSA